MAAKIVKTDAEWREQLSDLAYKVTREHATERAFTHDDFPAGQEARRRRPAHGLGDILARRFADGHLFQIGVARHIAVILVKRRAGGKQGDQQRDRAASNSGTEPAHTALLPCRLKPSIPLTTSQPRPSRTKPPGPARSGRRSRR